MAGNMADHNQSNSTDTLTGTELFALFAGSEDALSIIDLNPDFEWRENGRRALVFRTDRPSKKAGYVATFGRHASNDIRLPSSKGTLWSGTGQSGELILHDLSTRHTNIEVENATPEEQDAYAIQSDQPSSHRQRVIPRMTRNIHIVIGTGTVFLFRWVSKLAEGHAAVAGPEVQRQLIRHAHESAVPDMTPSMPDDEDTESVPVYETRAQFAPRVSSALVAYRKKKYHNYATLGAGTYGTVSKVVDLKTGELWAVKSINLRATDDGYKMTFKQEVELLSQLRHPNILNLESFQDFTVDGRFDIFTQLHDGNLQSLLPPHMCARDRMLQTMPEPQPWVTSFIEQILSGLQYLHQQGLIYRDIKPTAATGPPQLHFVIGDFGQARFQTSTNPSTMGTLMYAAPELLSGEVYPESDVWSFAVTFLQVLGYIRPLELDGSDMAWAAKLVALGVGIGFKEPPPPIPMQNEDRLRRWCGRLVSLVQGGCLPAVFSRMLCPADTRLPAALLSTISAASFAVRPSRPRIVHTDSNGVEWRQA
ncbi:kinase-like domain-containing protein [Cercophora scortea]|uniref:Kinase-like domain-containing protein n=1 Tax=Cercophora scortea TaxID=314031 RepID=A0AAE0IW66_9PEZI|nr:kinase-like domain-containing protein [Cercophora scortea]